MVTTDNPARDAAIERRIAALPRLASLRSINLALSELINAEFSITSQISEIIRRDPSLTARLLKLVNSVFFGLPNRITNIEEAVFYLGLRQIRELALATPVIEELESLRSRNRSVDWSKLWQHSIGTAILTREILSVCGHRYEDDTDYISGLVHNVGKIVIALAFAAKHAEVLARPCATTAEVSAAEREHIGWDHAKIGAHYLKIHQLCPEVVEAVAHHNNPGAAPAFSHTSAAIQVADHMVRSVGIAGIEEVEQVEPESWEALEGWQILFPDPEEAAIPSASLRHSLARLPELLNGLV